MGHVLKTCPLSQLIHIVLQWQKRQTFGKVGLKIGLAGEVNNDEHF